MEVPKTSQAIVKADGCSLQHDGKALLLKTQLTCVAENERMELVPQNKLHPYGLAFMVLEGILPTTRGERQSSILQYHPAANSETYNSDQPA